MKRLGCSLLPVLLASMAACDPCFGTGACVDPYLYADGRLIWLLDGDPAGGVRVVFRPAGNSDLIQDSLVAVTNDEGVFRFRASVPRSGEVTGSLVFHPPSPYQFFVYQVTGVRLETSNVRGDPNFIGYWGVGPLPADPHISYVGEVFYVDTNERAEGVEVEFRRTGGIPVRPDTFVVHSNAQGRFPLFMKTSGEGTVVGNLYIRPAEPYLARVVEGVVMETTIAKDYIQLLSVWGLER